MITKSLRTWKKILKINIPHYFHTITYIFTREDPHHIQVSKIQPDTYQYIGIRHMTVLLKLASSHHIIHRFMNQTVVASHETFV